MIKATNNQLLYGLLLVLLASVLVPAFDTNDTWLGQLFSLLIITVTILVLEPLTKKKPRIRFWLKWSGITLIMLNIAGNHDSTPDWLSYVSLLTIILFEIALMTLLMMHLFSNAAMDEKLLAAVNFYFLTGITFGFIYTLLSLMLPGAFNFPSNSASQWHSFIYFSFINLTTLGYGDITPVNSVAKSLVVIEASLGVLSPTVMIARFVRSGS